MSSTFHPRSSKKALTAELFPDAKVPRLSHDVSDKSSSSVESVSSAMLGEKGKRYTTFMECENDAILAMDAGRQGSFSRIVLQSPSPHSFILGVLFAAKLNWCNALRSLLLATRASPKPTVDESDIISRHPLFIRYFQQDGHDFSSNAYSETTFEEHALLIAAFYGSSRVVQVLVEFIHPNFKDMVWRPFLSYVYMNKDKASRRKCLRVILPKLELSDRNLAIAAENGDFASVAYLIKRMKVAGEFLYFDAVGMAIKHGHDELAKWIMSQPDLILWKRYSGILLLYATEAQNLDMLVFISGYVPKLLPCEIGFATIDALWKFLRDKDQELYRRLVPKFPDGYVLFNE